MGLLQLNYTDALALKVTFCFQVIYIAFCVLYYVKMFLLNHIFVICKFHMTTDGADPYLTWKCREIGSISLALFCRLTACLYLIHVYIVDWNF